MIDCKGLVLLKVGSGRMDEYRTSMDKKLIAERVKIKLLLLQRQERHLKKFPPKSWTHPTSFEWGQSTKQQWCQHRGLHRKNIKSDCKENPLCTGEILKQTLDCTVYTFLHRSLTGCFSFRCDGKSTHILFALINIFGFTAAGCSDSGKAFTYAPWRQRGKWRRSPKRTSRLSSRRMPLCCLQSLQLL